MNELDFYSAYLHPALAHRSQMSPEAVACTMVKFEKLAAVSSPEFAFASILESYGNESTPDAIAKVKSQIFQALEKFNREHPGVQKTATVRLSDLIQRHNRALEKCASIEINGVPLTRDEIEKIKIRIPGCCKTETFTAQASAGTRKPAKLILEIRY